jgi:circadian clock protein KaiC
MGSIGMNLSRWIKKGLLRVHAARPTLYGLEAHLATMHRDIDQFKHAVVVVDPLSSFGGGTVGEIHATLIRLVDYLKTQQITAVFTHLISGTGAAAGLDKDIEVGVSSLMDTWILFKWKTPALASIRDFCRMCSTAFARQRAARRVHTARRVSAAPCETGRPW